MNTALVGRVLAIVAAVALGLYILTDKNQIKFLLLGLGSGALIAAIGLGVVLTYRGSGVVNFATGAMAMYVAYIFDGLRTEARLYLPPLPNPLILIEGPVNWFRDSGDKLDLPNWPTSISLGDSVAFIPALAIALAVAALLGLVLHLLVFRPLRYAPQLAKVVATVGLLILLQAIVVLRFTGNVRPVREILPKQPVTFFDITIPRNQLILAGLTVVLAAVLWAVFRFTRFGLATRAAAENEKGAVVLGFSPDMLAGVNWVLSAVLAGLVGILVSPLLQLDPTTITFLIVPALGAALMGNFTSFGITAATGLGIGMFQSLITYWGTLDWFPRSGTGPLPGVREALPFLVIVVAMFVRGKGLPTRGTLGGGRLPFAARPDHIALRAAIPSLVCLAALLVLGPDWRLAIINTLIGVVICLSIVVITGFVGQISLAQMTLAGVAGFALSKLAIERGVPFPVAPLLAACIAALFGLLIAIPALRVRGVNLAVVTLAAALAIENFVFKNTQWAGSSSGARVPPPEFLGHRFGPNEPTRWLFYEGDGKLPNPWFGVFCLVVVVLMALLVVNLRRSTTGRQMLGLRSNERAAAAAGINVAGTKLLAFGFSAFVAGIGGSLSGYRFGSVTALYFGSFASLTFLAFAYLGGIASVTGAVIAGTLVAGGVGFTFLDKFLGVGDEYTFLLGGLGLILTAVLNPEGIVGAFRATGELIRHKLAVRRGRSPEGEPATGAEQPVLAGTAGGH